MKDMTGEKNLDAMTMYCKTIYGIVLAVFFFKFNETFAVDKGSEYE